MRLAHRASDRGIARFVGADEAESAEPTEVPEIADENDDGKKQDGEPDGARNRGLRASWGVCSQTRESSIGGERSQPSFGEDCGGVELGCVRFFTQPRVCLYAGRGGPGSA